MINLSDESTRIVLKLVVTNGRDEIILVREISPKDVALFVDQETLRKKIGEQAANILIDALIQTVEDYTDWHIENDIKK